MSLVYLPHWSYGNVAIASLQVLGLGGCASELQGQNAGYSKFANPEKKWKVQSRTGMLLLYSPALVVAVNYLRNAPKEAGNGREWITAALLVAHFGKRVLECLFLHKYSGTMDADFLIPISASYALTTTLIAHQQLQVPQYSHKLSGFVYGVGLALSVIGQLGNLYHHWLLAQLRKGEESLGHLLAQDLQQSASSGGSLELPKEFKSTEHLSRVSHSDHAKQVFTQRQSNSALQRYVIPSGGLFRFVTMPHYFCELLSWLGLACVTQQFNAFMTVADMTSYLAGRSVATTRWYRAKFDTYPSQTRHLIPFLF